MVSSWKRHLFAWHHGHQIYGLQIQLMSSLLRDDLKMSCARLERGSHAGCLLAYQAYWSSVQRSSALLKHCVRLLTVVDLVLDERLASIPSRSGTHARYTLGCPYCTQYVYTLYRLAVLYTGYILCGYTLSGWLYSIPAGDDLCRLNRLAVIYIAWL